MGNYAKTRIAINDWREMTALAIFEVSQIENPTIEQIKDYEIYRSLVPDLIEKHNGKYLIRGGNAQSLEGVLPAARWHVIEFESVDAVNKFWQSDEYQRIKGLRAGVVSVRAVIVSG